MNVRELYTPKRMTATGMICAAGGSLGGFFCTTGGTVQITVGEAAGGADMVSAFTAVAGTFYPLGFRCDTGAFAVLTTAIGTFLV
jgi:hypothetical protein